MQGTIAQVVALVLEGNAVLRGIGSPGLDSAHSAMKFCEFVRFVDLDKTPKGWSERHVADDPMAWFRYLKDRKVNELRMSYGASSSSDVDGSKVPDRMLVGFVGGGGRWLVHANGPNGSDYWEARWTIGDRQRADQRIWQVAYGRVAKGQATSENETCDLLSVRSELRDVLERVKAFATAHGLPNFAGCFARGLEDLTAASPAHAFHKEFANASLIPLEAIQLLSAAQSSWVFGGMGSWNDLGFEGEDQVTYESLSEELYRTVNGAIVAATNASAAGNASSDCGRASNRSTNRRAVYATFPVSARSWSRPS